jgi:hypothetical protein
MLVKLPPVITRCEELAKNDMYWQVVRCNLKGFKENLRMEQVWRI